MFNYLYFDYQLTDLNLIINYYSWNFIINFTEVKSRIDEVYIDYLNFAFKFLISASNTLFTIGVISFSLSGFSP